MRKLTAILTAAAVSGALALAAPAAAAPSDKCGGTGAKPGTDGAASASVCVDDLGALTISAREDGTGYVVVDGDEGNALTQLNGCLDGFIGLQVNGTSGTGYVSSGDGDYGFPREDVNAQPNPGACS